MIDYSNLLIELSDEDKKLLTETIDLTFKISKKAKKHYALNVIQELK